VVRTQLFREFRFVRTTSNGGNLESHVPCILDTQMPKTSDP
jgi:hypothetical protein